MLNGVGPERKVRQLGQYILDPIKFAAKLIAELLMFSCRVEIYRNDGITHAIDVVIGERHVPGCGYGPASNRMEEKRISSVPPRRA